MIGYEYDANLRLDLDIPISLVSKLYTQRSTEILYLNLQCHDEGLYWTVATQDLVRIRRSVTFGVEPECDALSKSR